KSLLILLLRSFRDTKLNSVSVRETQLNFVSVRVSSEMVEEVSVLEPQTRKHFLQYGCQLTLDPNTAFRNLCLSEGNREVTRVEEIQSYPDHPERFERWAQVLCREDGCQLTLDPNTAHRYLCLSEGNREVTRVGEIRSYPDHPERFEPYLQVLCREGVSGCCYWEAERSRDWVSIAVSYKEISRKG
ncbi:hypothetical protein COCON_G00147620, partial [Conger conger]